MSDWGRVRQKEKKKTEGSGHHLQAKKGQTEKKGGKKKRPKYSIAFDMRAWEKDDRGGLAIH